MNLARSFSRGVGRTLPNPDRIRCAPIAAALLISLAAVAAPVARAASDPTPLSLAEARQLALGSDEMLQQTAEAIAAARADQLEARAGRLPQLALGGTWTRNWKKPSFFLPPEFAAGMGGVTSVEMGGDWDLQAAATLTWNLWTAGRLSAAGEATAEALAASEWQQAAARDAVIYGVDAAYSDALLAAEQVRIAEQSQELAAEALRVTAAAHEQGTASRFELLRAQVELANREAPLLQARNQHQAAVLRLLRLCGLPAGTRLELTDPLGSAATPAPLEELLQRMREQSPELKALDHSVAAARQSLRLARAERGPVVQLQGQYALQGQWNDDILPDSNEAVSSASTALAVSIPLFDGFTTKASIQRGQARLRTTEIERERILRDRELSVRQARLNVENALAALAGREEAVDLAAEAYRLVIVRQENGMATALDRLDAELALTEARVQLAASLYNCNLAQAGLELAIGGAASAAAVEENGQ